MLLENFQQKQQKFLFYRKYTENSGHHADNIVIMQKILLKQIDMKLELCYNYGYTLQI